MIRIQYSLSPEFSFEVKGHAHYDVIGKDIVCSAVTAVVIGGINALENNKNMNIEVKEGLIRVKSEKSLSEKDFIVFHTILTQLQSISEEYPNNVKIK